MSTDSLNVTNILWFSDAEANESRWVGGKGANLGYMTKGGFDVPAGFTITTSAYSAFIDKTGLEEKVARILQDVDYASPDSIEDATAAIRGLLVSTPMPQAIADEIRAAYQKLGKELYVAVRSSGAAEDLAEASFAGLHDTYLDICGEDALIDAVQRCWASVWTGRATSYRHTKGFVHSEAPIAVVVQQMVSSEVSGVMFTANPMTTVTDEIVINASWGLGEAVVQGITTPDAFVLKAGTLRILEKTLGSKAVRIVRDPETGKGTVTQEVPMAERGHFTLSDTQLFALGDLGRRIQKHYGDFPQDIEWGYADGQFFVLQSRPVTGVELSWDAEVNDSVPGVAPDDQLWSRNFADEGWTGAVTPLMFSWRGLTMNAGHSHCAQMCGFPDLDYTAKRLWQFNKGKAYFNPDVDRGFIEQTVPPALRAGMLGKLPAIWREETAAAPFSYLKYAQMYFRLQTLVPHEGLNWTDTLAKVLKTEAGQYNGLSVEETSRLSDVELERYIDRMIALEGKFYDVVWTGLMVIFRDAISLLGLLTAKWYDGDNPGIFTDLITGTNQRTLTAIENGELWKISQHIRGSETLMSLFQEKPGAEFFKHLPDSADGRELLKIYDSFVQEHGHRGHADRDIYFSRRAEDPGVDYRALQVMLTVASPVDPEMAEHAVNERRRAATALAVENIKQKPFGSIKAEIFKLLLDYVHRYIAGRDDERHFVDRSTFAIKRGFQEASRRLLARGILQGERDFYFLTKIELFELLHGRGNLPLAKAKIAGRMRDFDRVDSREVTPPPFVVRGKGLNLDAPIASGDGVLQGVGTSRGTVTGTARVVKTLKEIGRIKDGDILITNSTDPGWTPVFLVIKGIVLETGGMLAHGSLLAREYGFPAVQIDDAIQHIPDGATILLDGDAGVVRLLQAEPLSDEQTASAGDPAIAS